MLVAMLSRVFILNDESRPPSGRRASSFETTLCLTQLRQEFPTVRIQEARGLGAQALDDGNTPRISVADWQGLTWDPEAFDAIFLSHVGLTSEALCVVGAFEPATLRVVFEILSRYQLLTQRTNTHSATALFNTLLARHRELHDLSKPLVRADYFHALDTWQWTLRLRPTAGFDVQAAALFHDVARLVPLGQASAFTARLLAQAGVIPADAANIIRLTEEIDAPAGDAELALLSDAEALSFVSLTSPRFFDYHGEAQTESKLAVLLRRMRKESLPRLRTLKLRADVERVLVQALRRGGADDAPSPPHVGWPRDARLSS